MIIRKTNLYEIPFTFKTVKTWPKRRGEITYDKCDVVWMHAHGNWVKKSNTNSMIIT